MFNMFLGKKYRILYEDFYVDKACEQPINTLDRMLTISAIEGLSLDIMMSILRTFFFADIAGHY